MQSRPFTMLSQNSRRLRAPGISADMPMMAIGVMGAFLSMNVRLLLDQGQREDLFAGAGEKRGSITVSGVDNVSHARPIHKAKRLRGWLKGEVGTAARTVGGAGIGNKHRLHEDLGH